MKLFAPRRRAAAPRGGVWLAPGRRAAAPRGGSGPDRGTRIGSGPRRATLRPLAAWGGLSPRGRVPGRSVNTGASSEGATG